MTFPAFSGRLYPVSERNNNEIKNEMKNQMIVAPPAVLHDGFRGIAPLVITKPITDEVLVSCCGCGTEKHLPKAEADEWENTLFGVDAWMCWECE